MRHWISPHEAGIQEGKPGNTIGNQFYGSKGYLVINNYNKTTAVPRQGTAAGTDRHRARHALGKLHHGGAEPQRREDLNAEVEEGALSCNLMHLANISYRVGRTLHWDAKKMECTRAIRKPTRC